MDRKQAERQIGVSTPLGDDALLLLKMSGTEALGRMFRYDLDLLSEDESINPDDLLGQPASVRLAVGEDDDRFFHGFITEFEQVGMHGQLHRYRAVLRPWLWFLTRTADCRIFPDKSEAQTMTVPDIIKAVFREHGFTDFSEEFNESYKPWEHCVQYRESDFNFVSRLMEQEGIYYYFTHEETKHTLVLADAYSSHSAVSNYDTLPFYPKTNEGLRERDHIYAWSLRRSVQPGIVALDDFDFMRPTADLEVKKSVTREHQHAEYELFDYPGEYVEPADGSADDKQNDSELKTKYEKFAQNRIEEMHAGWETVEGTSNARGLMTGALFTLENHGRSDQNREYLITGAQYELESDPFETTAGSDPGTAFTCRIRAIDAQQPYRTPRITPKPVVQGPQTAIVAGPSGETVWTDQYGRVKLQFHWDRYGQSDENSSCWVRVSQNWAGPNWGGMFLPHVGQEVIVEFLEGDPDRPIITGRVYNEDNMPPLPLPDNKYKSIIRDHFGNQIEFNGTPGEENLTLYCPAHGSIMSLGRSKVDVTRSAGTSYSYGDSNSVHLGNQNSNVKGSSTSVFHGNSWSYKQGQSFEFGTGASYGAWIGLKGSVVLGGEVSLSAAWKISAGFSREFNYTKGNYKRRANDDIVFDSAKNVVLSGGNDDQTVFVSNDECISMTYGTSNPSKDMSAIDTFSAAMAAISGVLMAGSALWGSWAGGWGQAEEFKNSASRVEKKQDSDGKYHVLTEKEQLDKSMEASWEDAGSNAVGVIAGFAAIAGQSTDKPAHNSETAQVKVLDGEVEIWAGESDKSIIHLSHSEKAIQITGPDKVVVMAKEIVLKAEQKITLDAPEIKATKKIDQPNITASG